MADAKGLSQLCQQHAAYERIPFEAAGHAERLGLLLSNAQLTWWAWVLESEGELLGYATMTIDIATLSATPFAHLDCLFLQSQVRGQGWGKSFVDIVSQQAASLGCTELQWQTPAWNTSAIRFYEKLGASCQPKARFSLMVA